MRAMLALLLCAVILGPSAVADEMVEEDIQPLDHGPEDDHDSPGFGVLALVGIAAIGAFMRRRQ